MLHCNQKYFSKPMTTQAEIFGKNLYIKVADIVRIFVDFKDVQIFCRFADFLQMCRFFADLQIFCRCADFLQICRFTYYLVR